MALAESLTVDTGAYTAATGGIEKTFATTSRGAQSTERLDINSTLSDPGRLIVKHQTTGSEKNGDLTDRHLIQYSRTERDSEGRAYASVVNLTISVPRVGLFTNAEVEQQVNVIANLLKQSGVFSAILTNQS